VIVTGAGKAFSAGGDFELIKSILDNPVARMATWKEAKDLVYNVINCNKLIMPVLAVGGEKSFGPMMATVMRPVVTTRRRKEKTSQASSTC
jgi:hypothetical protein